MKLSIVLPIYNEEALIAHLLERLQATHALLCKTFNWSSSDIEWIFVNDGSTDSTLSLLQDSIQSHFFKILNLSRNFGHQIAITAGIECAKGEAVVVMDADLQDPPEEIVQLVTTYQKGWDVVYAIRKKRHGESLFKRISAHFFYRLFQKITFKNIPVNTGDFRLMSRRVIDVLAHMQEKHRFMRGMVSWVGFKQTGIEYERDARYAGSTKYPLSKMIQLALDGIIGFSHIPIRWISYCGFVSAGIGFLYAVYVLYLKLCTSQAIQGWTSLMVVVLLLGGIQLLFLGLIGEYIGQIHGETKKRPLYVIEGIYEYKG